MNLSKNEEDYLKALFHLIVERNEKNCRSKDLAEHMGIAPASVNAMLKKLKVKKLVVYEKYGKLQLSETGKVSAIKIIRKHRLWETFLYNHLNFNWEEVHEVAEQLEHIRSEKLINELDKFLGSPQKDPHGSSIPKANGEYLVLPKITLSEIQENERCRITGVKESSIQFLKYVSSVGLVLSTEIKVHKKRDFDGSVIIEFEQKKETVSQKFANNIYVELI